MLSALTLVAALAVGTAPSAAVPAAPQYHLIASIPLGDPMHWDYLTDNSATDRLFIAHGDHVDVFNTATGKVIGRLANLPGSHGIAIDPVSRRIYADSSVNTATTAYDPVDFKPIATVKTILDSDGMAYDKAARLVFVTGGDGNGLTPIDPATNTALPEIPLGGAPEFLAADGMGDLFVNIENQNQIARVDTHSRKAVARYKLGACQHPKGLADDAADRLLFSSCANGLMAVVTTAGHLVATLPIGQGTDAAAFDPVRHLAFAAASDGTITIIAAAHGHPRVVGTLHTAPGARTMAVDPATGRLYTVTATVTGENAQHRFVFAPGSLRLLVYGF
jgi:DNA-binding beta-propeller fold protein YncE